MNNQYLDINKENIEQTTKKNWWGKLFAYGFFVIILFHIVNYFLDHNKYFDIEEITKLNQARLFPKASLMGDSKVLITGGYKIDGSLFFTLLSSFLWGNAKINFPEYLKSTEIYDLNTNKIVSGPNMNYSHIEYNQYLLPTGEVLIAEPKNIESYNPKLNKFEKWDIETTAFANSKLKNSKYSSELENINTNMTLLRDGNILITGGAHGKVDDKNNYYTLSNAEILNTKTRTIEKIEDLPFPLANHHLFVDKDGLVYIFGGDIIYKNEPDKRKFNRAILLYNPKNRKFTIYKKHINNYYPFEDISIYKIDNQKFLAIVSYKKNSNENKYIYILDLKKNQFKSLYNSESNIHILNNKKLYSFQKHTVIIYDFENNTSVKKRYSKDLSNAKKIVDIGENKYLVIDENSYFKIFLGLKPTRKIYIIEIKNPYSE